MKKAMILFLVAVILCGCMQKGIPVKDVNTGDTPLKSDFNVVFLFEFKGVSVFRFTDGGYARYFSIGDGKFLPQVQSETHQDGKQQVTTYWIDGAEKGEK